MEPTHQHNDRELFRLIAAGDREAFASLFRTYSPPLYRNALRMLKSEFWAEDIIQVVFTQLWQNRAELTKVEMPSSYLYRMVTNKARDRMRSHEREIRMQYWLASQAEVESRQKENREELHLLLAKAVDSLPAQRKEVYQLKYQQKLSYEEIATRLSISRNTVRNHMAKALEDIRTYMIRHADILLLILYLSNF